MQPTNEAPPIGTKRKVQELLNEVKALAVERVKRARNQTDVRGRLEVKVKDFYSCSIKPGIDELLPFIKKVIASSGQYADLAPCVMTSTQFCLDGWIWRNVSKTGYISTGHIPIAKKYCDEEKFYVAFLRFWHYEFGFVFDKDENLIDVNITDGCSVMDDDNLAQYLIRQVEERTSTEFWEDLVAKEMK